MNLNNQSQYWNAVAAQKTFTHPLDISVLNKYINKNSSIVDFGCGYGRIIKELADQGFTNVIGFDTSKELIKRAHSENNRNSFHIENPDDLPVEDNSIDCILLFAVLTCIPSNSAQTELIKLLYSKLKRGGILYISDYYLQQNSPEVERYQYLDNDKNNFGVFTLSEGATFRHHTREWISGLTKDFTILTENIIELMTMNGHKAKRFQLVAQK